MPVKLPSTPGEDVILDGGGPTAGSDQPQLVPADKIEPAFHFAASLAELQLTPGGRRVPDLPKIPHREGVNGALGTGQPGQALDVARRKGRKVLPHAFPCVAWGRKHKGYLTRTLAGYDHKGREVHSYHDQWHRPVFVGSRFVRWEFDEAGWEDFRDRVMAWLLKEEGLKSVPPVYRELAADRLRSELKYLRGDSSSASERRRELEERLPREEEAA